MGDRQFEMSEWILMRCGAHLWHLRDEVARLPWFVERLKNPSKLLEGPTRSLRPPNSISPRIVVRRIVPEWPNRPLIIKRYQPRSPWEPVKDLCRGTQVSRTLRQSRSLEALGVPVARVLAALLRSRAGWGDSWIIMDEVPAALNLYEKNGQCRDALERHRLIHMLSQLMARLHDHDFEHADPSLTNFLVSQQSCAQPTLVLVDLDGIRHRAQTLQRAAKGLRRLALRAHISHRESLRFLVDYCRGRRTPLDARQMAQAVGSLLPGASSPRWSASEPAAGDFGLTGC